jgi:hypothetical protein
VFGAERVVFWREAAPGAGMDLSPLPYFIGKNLVELPRLAILTFCSVAFFYPFVSTLCNFDTFYLKAFSASWNISGWAVFLSILFNDKSAQLILVILCLVFMLYSGAQTRLSAMSSVEYGVSWLSPNRWLVEDLFICYVDALSAVFRLPTQWYDKKNDSLIAYLIVFTYSERFSGGSLSADGSFEAARLANPNQLNTYSNLWFGVLTRALGFVCLVYANRQQMAKPSIGVSTVRSLNTFLRIWWPELDIEQTWAALKKRAANLCAFARDLDAEALNAEWDKVAKSSAVERRKESRASISSLGALRGTHSYSDNGGTRSGVEESTAADEPVDFGAVYGGEENDIHGMVAMQSAFNSMAAAASSAAMLLPEGWAAVQDEASGRTFYHEAATGETSWELPNRSPLNATDV